MFPPFNPEKASEVLKQLLQAVEKGQVKIIPSQRVSLERQNHSVMLGSLVCADSEGNTVNLVTVSGVSASLKIEGELPFIYVPPVVSPEKINAALEENDVEIHALTDRINLLKKKSSGCNSGEIELLTEKRKKLCAQSLEKVYDLYSFHCAGGKILSLKDCSQLYNKGKLPPTGTGECAEPKLLDYAFSRNLTPLSMAQCLSGKDFSFVEPCDERCGIVLPAMLGLRIIYRDNDIIVVNKQSGILSVPGRGPDKQDCIVNRFRSLFPQAIVQPAVHRLDMETSGLMVLAFNREAHKTLNRQFEEGKVRKQYEALLDGVLAKKGIPVHGKNHLYFRLDIENRPHQIWDREHGKEAVTEWKIMNVEDYVSPSGKRRPVTRIKFFPHTGRTHQLRLVSSDSHGFGTPIIGDTLYGHCEKGERLMLHATDIVFTHPSTGEEMHFTSECEF